MEKHTAGMCLFCSQLEVTLVSSFLEVSAVLCCKCNNHIQEENWHVRSTNGRPRACNFALASPRQAATFTQNSLQKWD